MMGKVMNENDAIEIMKNFLVGTFPKTCNCCGRRYNTFAEYIRTTTPIGKPISYDADMGQWQPTKPMGTIGMANCSCGTTLAISSDGIPLATLWKLMEWSKQEIKKHGVSPDDFLESIRTKIDERVLQEERNHGTTSD